MQNRKKQNMSGVFVQSHIVICLCFIAQFLVIGTTNVNAQKSNFPIYDDQRISRPVGLRQFRSEDFIINLNRIEQYPNGFFYGNQELLKKLGDFLKYDPSGRNLWEKEINNVVKILNQWDFDRSEGFAADRYVKCISQLNNLSLVYIFTGQKDLGLFIRQHVLQITELPFEFWLHAELRGYNPDHPLGGLETSALCYTISFTLSATKDIYSASEKDKIEAALYDKGLKPCLNWLEKPRLTNWTAVVSKGAYIAAYYFNDYNGMSKALNAMKYYLDSAIEKDGSYGEGISYFEYPINSLLPAILLMNNNDRAKVFSSSGLRFSSRWCVYPYLYDCGTNDSCSSTIVHFGDSYFRGSKSPTVNIILALIYKDNLASWLLNKFKVSFSLWDKLLMYSFTEGLPEPKSPEQVGLPLLKVFNNGDCYIRSTWKDNGIVFAIKSGDEARSGFSHQRPELNSINLGAFGEYLIVSAGSASYRSPLRYQWDLTTKAANTITIDDKNQLFPGSGKSDWNKTDVSGFWEQGKPKATVVNSKAGHFADLIVSEASTAYHIPMKNVRRSVLFIRDPGYFVIIDKIEAVNSQHKYTWRIHLNNRDGNGNLKIIDNNHWYFTRPNVNLDVYLFADQELETSIGEGYMHGPTRDYSPGGPNEGELGSSIELEVFNPKITKSIIYYSVLIPSRKGIIAPSVGFLNKKIYVGKDTFTFSEGQCFIKKENQSEKYQLW